jgi:hypothetical protein
MSTPSLFPLTHGYGCFTQRIHSDLELAMKIAMDKPEVRYKITQNIIAPLASRLERLAPSVVWPVKWDQPGYDEEYLKDWAKLMDNLRSFDTLFPVQITNSIETIRCVFGDLQHEGLIPAENSHLVEAMQLQICCLQNPRSLVHFVESHAYFNVWDDARPLGFERKPVGSSFDLIYRLDSQKQAVETDIFDIEPRLDTPHLAWLKDPDTLASMMHTAGAAKRFQTTVAKVLEKPADDKWKAPLEMLLVAVSKYVPIEKVLTWKQAMDAFETDSSEDGDADEVGPLLLDITESMGKYLV